MDFLSNVFGWITGKKRKEEENRPAPQPVQGPAPILQKTPASAGNPAPQSAQVRAPELSPASLEKVQPTKSGWADQNAFGRMWEGVQTAASSKWNPFKYGADFLAGTAENIADAYMAPKIQAQMDEQNERSRIMDNQLVKASQDARTRGDAPQAQRLLSMTGDRAEVRDVLSDRYGNDRELSTPEQAAQNFGTLASLVVPGIGVPGKVAAMAPAARLAVSGAIRGAENAALQLPFDLLANPETADNNAAVNFGMGASLNTVFSPKLAWQALGKAKDAVLEIVPGIRSVNPAKIQEADQVVEQLAQQIMPPREPVATMTPRVENPDAGALTNRYGDQTVEDAMLEVPTFQRVQEQQALEQAMRSVDLRKAVDPNQPRALTDLTPTPLSTQDMHAPDAVQEAPNVQTFSRPEGMPLNAAYLPFPEAPGPRTMTDIMPPLEKAVPKTPERLASAADDRIAREAMDAARAAEPVQVRAAEPEAPVSNAATETPVAVADVPSQPNAPRETEEEILARLQKEKVSRSDANTEDYRRRVLAGELESARVQGDEPIIVYRATSDGPVKAGDFVTTSKEAADRYKLERPDSEIETITAPKSDFVQASGLQHELVYAPRTTQPEAPKPSKEPKNVPQSELPDTRIGGTAKTGEVGRSEGQFARGQEYEKTSVKASQERGAREATNESYETLTKRIEDNGGMSGADRDTALEISKRYAPGTPEHRRLLSMVNKYHGEAAQTLATIERVERKTADAGSLTDRFARKLYASTDDATEIPKDAFDSVIKKNTDFVAARDEMDAAVEAFNGDPSARNMERVRRAFESAEMADRASKFEEYKVAEDFSKNSSSPKTKDLVEQLKKDAGVYTMDMPDASMLSSTRVMLNNFINTLTVRGEEALFGKAGAKLARQLTGTNIGGGSRAGAKLGSELGKAKWATDAAMRRGADGSKLAKFVKNTVTGGNTIGERNTYAAAYSSVYDHYNAALKKAGYSGDELKNRTLVNTLLDSDGVVDQYMNQALVANGMSSTVGGKGREKFETWLTNGISRRLGDSKTAQFIAKSLVRVTVGFPTVVVRSAEQGARRSLLGTPSMLQAVANAAKGGSPEVTAQLVKNSVKEAGSGAAMFALGGALGARGMISGAYPSDKDERARWEREGISENSIKIGKDWYQLPAALGVFALPFMLGANAGQNVADGEPLTEGMMQKTVSTLINTMPVDSFDRTVQFFKDVEGGRDVSKYLASTGAGLVRAATPAGSFINQLAKSFDGTANDTSQGDALAQFVSKVFDGIPGLANTLEDKEVGGNPVKNPNPIARLFGAVSTEQGAGVQKTGEIEKTITDTNRTLDEYGAFNDSIRNILDDETKAIFDKVKNGKKVDESDMKALIDGMTKNVTEESDTRFLEDGDYANNLAVLKAKRDRLAADPTTRKDTLEAYDDQIKRGEIYRDQKTPYALTKGYKDTSLEEWRALGNPESDDYDPERYQQLWDLDAALTEAGVSRKSGDKTKQKYYAKKSGGSGGGVSKKISSNTVGSPANLGKITPKFDREKAGVAPVPKVAKLKPNELVKKRKISVSR